VKHKNETVKKFLIELGTKQTLKQVFLIQ